MVKRFSKALMWLSMAVSVVILVAGLVINLSAVKALGDQVRNMRELETVADSELDFYFDSFFINNFYRFEGDGDEASSRDDLENFISATTSELLVNTFSTCAIFVVVAVILSSGFICSYFAGRKHALLMVAIGSYVMSVALVVILWAVAGIGFADVTMMAIVGMLCSLMAVAAVALLLELIHKKIRFKNSMVCIALVLAVIGYFSGFLAKERIWTEAYENSFAYLEEIDPRVFEEEYQDEINWIDASSFEFMGTEYEAAQTPNLNHAFGASYVMNWIFEVINPTTGIYVGLDWEVVGESTIAPWVYVALEAVWIGACLLVPGKNRVPS